MLALFWFLEFFAFCENASTSLSCVVWKWYPLLVLTALLVSFFLFVLLFLSAFYSNYYYIIFVFSFSSISKIFYCSIKFCLKLSLKFFAYWFLYFSKLMLEEPNTTAESVLDWFEKAEKDDLFWFCLMNFFDLSNSSPVEDCLPWVIIYCWLESLDCLVYLCYLNFLSMKADAYVDSKTIFFCP